MVAWRQYVRGGTDMSRTPEAPGLTEGDMEAPGLRRRLRTQAEAEKGEAEICFGSFLTWANAEPAHGKAALGGASKVNCTFSSRRNRRMRFSVRRRLQNALFREARLRTEICGPPRNPPQAGGGLLERICPVEAFFIVPRSLAGGCPTPPGRRDVTERRTLRSP